MNDRKFYLDDWSDEIIPCEPTLEGWAEWLSKPDSNWGRDEAAKDGDTFRASVLRFEADVVATKGPDGWSFSHQPDGAALLAVRFGRGLGWDAEGICYDWDGVRAVLDEQSGDEPEYIAVGFEEPAVRLRFSNSFGTPRLHLDGTVQ